MKKIRLLLEGGVAGHLSHLYDNPALTFNEIAAILTKASEGELVGTEKTDGYNIYLGCRRGTALYARNKGDMASGGRDIRHLNMREFAGGQQVKDVYLKSFQAFQKAVDSLSPEEQVAIFGRRGEIFYNTEIMGPGASNVVNYDANIIGIHHGGHKKYDPSTDRVVGVDATQNSQYLDSLIDRFEQATQGEDFSVQRTATMQLKAISDGGMLERTIDRLKETGFSGSMTIGEYLEDKLRSFMDTELSYFPPNTQQDVLDKILKTDNAKNLRLIYKGYGPQEADAIRNIVNKGPEILKQLIFPIEDAIHDFSVELLKGLESMYILDNRAEVKRLQGEARQAIEQISQYSGPGQEEAHEILKKQLKKLKNHKNINTAVEGFVFEYNGTLYKFTGNFAPVNQLLGLFKYGRGQVPSIQRSEDPLLKEGMSRMPSVQAPDDLYKVLSQHKSIGVFPGGFKPPHKGHFKAAENMAAKVELPIVIMGHPTKTRQRKIGGKPVTFETALSIWETYANDAGVELYILEAPPGGNPMHIAYDILQNASPGQTIHMIAGGKDAGRFKGQAETYVPEGVSLDVEPMPNTIDPDTKKPMSATHFREAVEQGKDITKFIPETSKNSQDMIKSILGGKVQESINNDVTGLIFSLVEQQMPYEMIVQALNQQAIGPAIEQTMGTLEQGFAQKGEQDAAAAAEWSEMLQNVLAGMQGKQEADAGFAQSIMEPVGGALTSLPDAVQQTVMQVAQQSQQGNEADAKNEKRRETEKAMQQQDMMAEISAAGGAGASIEGAPGQKKKKKQPTIFREEDEEEIDEELIETVINYLLQSTSA